MTEPKVAYEEKRERFESLGDPPRHIPPMLTLSLIFDKICIVGAAVMSFGLIFFWLFFHPKAVLQDHYLNTKGVEVLGIVTSSTETNYEVNERDVYRIDFTFKTPRGEQTGFAYSTDSSINSGADVTVQYLENEPQVSRIKGTRRDPIGWAGGFVIIFPFAGLMVILGGISKGLKTVSLMKNGILADAEVLDVRTPPRSGDSDTSVLSEIVLKYVDDRGNERTFTHSTSNIFDVGDEPRELILFDPTNPKKAFPIDEFYKKVEIDNRGEIQDASPGSVVLTVGAVLLLLAPHVIYFVWHYFIRGN